MKRFLAYLLTCTSLLFLQSCDRDEPIVPERVLVSATQTLTRTAGELRTFLTAGGFKIDINALQYDVEINNVVYKTTFNGQEI